MKKVLLVLILFTAIVTPTKKAHALDPKGKAFLIICTYGTVGGALLGFASMAFGTNSRAIAQGASLGLYAGIAFGSYVLATHGQQNEPVYQEQGPPPGYYDGYGAPPPVQDPSTLAPGQGLPSSEPLPADDRGFGGGGGFFGGAQRSIEINEDMVYNFRLKNKKGRDFSPPVYLNLVNMTF